MASTSDALYMLLVGRNNSGKSSLINAIFDEDLEEISIEQNVPSTEWTRHDLRLSMLSDNPTEHGIKPLYIFETLGSGTSDHGDSRKLLTDAVKKHTPHCILFPMDISRLNTNAKADLSNLKQHLNLFSTWKGCHLPEVIVVLTHCDLIDQSVKALRDEEVKLKSTNFQDFKEKVKNQKSEKAQRTHCQREMISRLEAVNETIEKKMKDVTDTLRRHVNSRVTVTVIPAVTLVSWKAFIKHDGEHEIRFLEHDFRWNIEEIKRRIIDINIASLNVQMYWLWSLLPSSASSLSSSLLDWYQASVLLRLRAQRVGAVGGTVMGGYFAYKFTATGTLSAASLPFVAGLPLSAIAGVLVAELIVFAISLYASRDIVMQLVKDVVQLFFHVNIDATNEFCQRLTTEMLTWSQGNVDTLFYIAYYLLQTVIELLQNPHPKVVLKLWKNFEKMKLPGIVVSITESCIKEQVKTVFSDQTKTCSSSSIKTTNKSSSDASSHCTGGALNRVTLTLEKWENGNTMNSESFENSDAILHVIEQDFKIPDEVKSRVDKGTQIRIEVCNREDEACSNLPSLTATTPTATNELSSFRGIILFFSFLVVIVAIVFGYFGSSMSCGTT